MIAVVYFISSRIGTKLLPLNLPTHQAVIELSARLQLACPYVEDSNIETLLPK